MEKELFQSNSEFKSAADSLDLNMTEVEGRDLPTEAAAATDDSIYACCCTTCCC
ncbi:hypothetical protein ACAW74_14845 [Fibrella sp. WM1]|uniref:Thiazolylpeptide-type bacteriocin n=1 Tax=Fibrella aestuarina BUZ 2 TaxID=1166018 RepID=I0K5E2_9BACT|nr:hypothetical protein [Fibrella aestuarina]CCG99345.1 hypothetical protein FAES_1335 [Fibrella aestuarina BUZ 2]